MCIWNKHPLLRSLNLERKTRVMPRREGTIALFDVDGTLTVPRKVRVACARSHSPPWRCRSMNEIGVVDPALNPRKGTHRRGQQVSGSRGVGGVARIVCLDQGRPDEILPRRS